MVAVPLLAARDVTLPTNAPALSEATKQRVGDGYGKLPLSFTPNRGQTDGRVRFYAQGSGHAFYFTRDKAVLAFTEEERGVALELTPLGANPDARLVASDRTPGHVNYLVGSERHANLPTYHQLTYRELWPGIDMVFRGNGGKLKYEFHVAPSANPADIRLAYRGADGLALGAAGNLLIQTPLGTMRDSRPVSYQRVDGKRVPVSSRYDLKGSTAYGFALGASYDAQRPLVIDPGLVYSTYLGGTGDDIGRGIAIDGSGAAYVTGETASTDFPTSAGGFDTTPGGGVDVFVTKLNATGSALEYSTYLGGGSADAGNGIAIDGGGAAYVTGTTKSTDFPTTAGAFDTTYNGGSFFGDDAFVTKLNASGSAPLAYSTYLGGAASDDIGYAIAVDGSGAAYITGITDSSNFPTTAGAFDTTYNGGSFGYDAFITKLNPTGSGPLAYSTFLGGAEDDEYAGAIAVDGSGDAYVTGTTESSNFPTTVGAFDTTLGGQSDAYVTKLNATGSALAYSTYLGGQVGGFGGAYDYGSAIAVDASGSAYLAGVATSTDFPTTAGAYDTTHNGGFNDGYVTKLNPSGTAPLYSTYLGGSDGDQALGIAIDGSGAAYVTGITSASANFPTTVGAHDTTHGGINDAFVSKLNATGSALRYSSFLGGPDSDQGNGIAIDGSGAAYVTGTIIGDPDASGFTTSAGAYDTTPNGSEEAYVTKLDTLVGPPYARPGSASPLRVPIVPAYTECTSPNSTHVLPLDYPSCTPQALESTLVKMGSGGLGFSFARFTVAAGDPGTVADEADIGIQVYASDIRKPDNTDYTGQLVFSAQMRITDLGSGSSGEAGATVQDTAFEVPVTCVDNGANGGAVCALLTTADTLVPGFAREGSRAVISALAIDLLDVGADSSITPGSGTCPPTCGSGDEKIVLTEGLLTP